MHILIGQLTDSQQTSAQSDEWYKVIYLISDFYELLDIALTKAKGGIGYSFCSNPLQFHAHRVGTMQGRSEI